MVVVTAAEARHPRRDLARAMKFIYLVPLSFYVLLSFAVGLNINYWHPDLIRPYSNDGKGRSPFIIALRSTGIKGLPEVVNACFLFSAYSAG